MKALVTGGASGIGAAIVARLRAEGYDVEVLDLVNGFDVADPEAWDRVGSVDLACLNAGVLTGEADISRLRVDQLMNFAWKGMIPLSIANIVFACAWYEFAIRPGGASSCNGQRP